MHLSSCTKSSSVNRYRSLGNYSFSTARLWYSCTKMKSCPLTTNKNTRISVLNESVPALYAYVPEGCVVFKWQTVESKEIRELSRGCWMLLERFVPWWSMVNHSWVIDGYLLNLFFVTVRCPRSFPSADLRICPAVINIAKDWVSRTCMKIKQSIFGYL